MSSLSNFYSALIITMKQKYIQILGIFLTLVYGFLILWLYWAAPKNLEEVSTKAKETIENTTTKGQIIIGTYEVDAAKFGDGLKAFRADNFVAARSFFEKLVVIVKFAETLPVKTVSNVKLRFRIALFRVGIVKKLPGGDKIIGAKSL